MALMITEFVIMAISVGIGHSIVAPAISKVVDKVFPKKPE